MTYVCRLRHSAEAAQFLSERVKYKPEKSMQSKEVRENESTLSDQSDSTVLVV